MKPLLQLIRDHFSIKPAQIAQDRAIVLTCNYRDNYYGDQRCAPVAVPVLPKQYRM